MRVGLFISGYDAQKRISFIVNFIHYLHLRALMGLHMFQMDETLKECARELNKGNLQKGQHKVMKIKFSLCHRVTRYNKQN